MVVKKINKKKKKEKRNLHGAGVTAANWADLQSDNHQGLAEVGQRFRTISYNGYIFQTNFKPSPRRKAFFFFFSFFVLFLLLMEIFLVTVLNLSHGNGLNVIMKNY